MAETPFNQAFRPIEIQTPLGDDVLGLRSFVLQERLGRPFVIEAELSSADPAIAFERIVGHPVVIRVDHGAEGRRFIHAFVARFQSVGKGPRFHHYRATLVPWIWALTRSADCRIFQDKTAPEIVVEVFRDRGAKDFEQALQGTYPKYEQCVQYRETDHDFVHRLLEREGIAYFFRHTEEKGLLVLADDKSAYAPAEGFETLKFRPGVTEEQQEPFVTAWVVEQEVKPVQFAHTDYNPLDPPTPLLRLAQIDRDHGINDRQVFDFPGSYSKGDDGERLARMRLEELQADGEVVRATTNCLALSAGNLLTLAEHPREDQNREYLITALTFFADCGDFVSNDVPQQTFNVQFTAIPSTQVFRPARVTPRPVVHGPQPGVVVGPSGEEIHTDELGRVKVHFHWNRESAGDDKSSAWVRVAQGWAGKKYGNFFLPRIGHEVLVEFLEGDPDRPVVTGSLYNKTNEPPYPLPAEKTKSTLKTLTSPDGGGYNELRFEDKKGKEEVFLHAERNLEVRVKASHHELVGGVKDTIVGGDTRTKLKSEHHFHVVGNELQQFDADRHTTVAGNTHLEVGASEHRMVKADRHSHVVGDDNLTVEGNLNVAVGAQASLDAADIHELAGGMIVQEATDISLKAKASIVLEAGSQISLKVGGNFVDIGPGGVTIVGTMTKVNSGGAAAAAAGCSPICPAEPAGPEVKDPGAPPTGKPGEVTKFSAAAEVLKYAALTGLPFCEECPREVPPPQPGPDEPEEVVAQLVSIAVIETDGTESGDVVQFVNLPVEDARVDADNGVTSKARLGRKVAFKVAFDQPGAHEFTVRLVPGDENLVFTDAEVGRNANFKQLEEEKTYTTDADGTKVVTEDVEISCAGGHTYRLEAEDPAQGTIVESGTITGRRLGYLVPILMQSMDASVVPGAQLQAEFDRSGMRWVELPAARITDRPNIGSPEEENQFIAACRQAFQASQGNSKAPHAIGAGFTQHLAVKHENVDLVLEGWPVGPTDAGGMEAEIPVEAVGLRAGDGLSSRPLWINIVPGEGWFVSAKYEPDGGGAAVDLVEADLTPIPVVDDRPDFCETIRVRTEHLPTGFGTLRLRVHVVDRMRGGLSFGGTNIVCACLRAFWRDLPTAEVGRALIHEVGHQFRMVTDGSGNQPDAVPTRYVDRGHVGPHCHNGLPLQDSFSGVTSGNACVMFGTILEEGSFCPDCTKAVRKMDISDGFPPS